MAGLVGGWKVWVGEQMGGWKVWVGEWMGGDQWVSWLADCWVGLGEFDGKVGQTVWVAEGWMVWMVGGLVGWLQGWIWRVRWTYYYHCYYYQYYYHYYYFYRQQGSYGSTTFSKSSPGSSYQSLSHAHLTALQAGSCTPPGLPTWTLPWEQLWSFSARSAWRRWRSRWWRQHFAMQRLAGTALGLLICCDRSLWWVVNLRDCQEKGG